MSTSGFMLFLILLFLAGCGAFYGIVLLLRLCEQLDISSYERLGEEAFGRTGKLLASGSIMMQVCVHLRHQFVLHLFH